MFGTILKVSVCALGGAFATVVVLAGAVLATCLTFVFVLAQGLRPLASRLPRAAQKDAEAPARATARTASVSAYSPTA